MKNMKNRVISAALIVGLMTVLSGCGSNEEVAVGGNEPVAPVVDVVQEPDTPADPYDGIWYFDRKNAEGKVHSYLSGEWVTPEVRNTRPVAFMTENTQEALPHYSTSLAKIVYESPVEGSITRMMAIYEDPANANMERIGNIRSARPYFIHFANEYDAMLCHAGQSIHAEVLFNQGIIDNLNGLKDKIANAMFYRTTDMAQPHNYYANSNGLNKAIDAAGYRKTLKSNYDPMMLFAEDNKPNTLESGSPCEVIKMYYFYNHPYFVYNKDDQRYYKYEFGAAEMDAATGKQLAFDNLIIMECDYSMYEQTSYLNIKVTGSGNGKFFTNGKMVDIRWARASEDCHTIFTYADTGAQVELNQGQTYVLVAQTAYADQSTFYATKAEFDAAR